MYTSVLVHTLFLLSDEMSVGFIYTFGVTEDRERESFYLALPTDVRMREEGCTCTCMKGCVERGGREWRGGGGSRIPCLYGATHFQDTQLNFEFDIQFNPNGREVKVQLFLGKSKCLFSVFLTLSLSTPSSTLLLSLCLSPSLSLTPHSPRAGSENYWVLANLTDPITVRGTGSFSREIDDKSGNKNASESQLFSFARSSLRNSPNFTELFFSRTEHDYTSKLWNGDVALIIRVYNLTQPLSYKVCVGGEVRLP